MSIWTPERYDDHEAAWRIAFQGMQTGLWTAEPGIIQTPLQADGTTTVQLAIQGRIVAPDGTVTLVPIAPLIYCPVKFLGGGGLYITHPIAQGDECLVIFARRCIDSWWQNGGVQPPLSLRLHDLSDGFCVPGFFSKANALTSVSASSIQIRTRSDVIADITDTQITFMKKLVVEADISCTGTVTGQGNVVAGTGASKVDVLNHLHSDSGGTGNSGPPVPGS